MAKPKLIISKTELQTAIIAVEENGPFANRSLLHEAVANTEWAKNHKPKPVTASVVMLRIEEFGIEPQTPKGRNRSSVGGSRTKSSSVSPATRQPRSKSEKMRQPQSVAIFTHLSSVAPTSFQRTIERARKGSMAAALRLHCAQCVGFENVAANVRGCITRDCPLWPFRPYQVTIKGRELTDDDIEHGVTEDQEAAVA